MITRKIDQQIRIGDDIVVTVLRIRGSQVRLGIDAPDEVIVNRAEIEQAKECQQNETTNLRTRT